MKEKKDMRERELKNETEEKGSGINMVRTSRFDLICTEVFAFMLFSFSAMLHLWANGPQEGGMLKFTEKTQAADLQKHIHLQWAKHYF